MHIVAAKRRGGVISVIGVKKLAWREMRHV